MKRINAMVSDEAKEILVERKHARGLKTLDEALDDLLHRFKELVKANYERADECEHVRPDVLLEPED